MFGTIFNEEITIESVYQEMMNCQRFGEDCIYNFDTNLKTFEILLDTQIKHCQNKEKPLIKRNLLVLIKQCMQQRDFLLN